MITLLVGFDSAWTAKKCGAIVGVLQFSDGSYGELELPLIASYEQARQVILEWQLQYHPHTTLILLDQPTIVGNRSGQRPVEHLVSSAVSRRYGGMQPANTGRSEMFGERAPVWAFLSTFGGAADPRQWRRGTMVVESYPVLTMISLNWTLLSDRETGRLPKYNPDRRKTFSSGDWQHVCARTADELRAAGLQRLAAWIDRTGAHSTPSKHDQDRLDSCLCLLVGLYLTDGQECLMVGDMKTGHVLVPFCGNLWAELEARCRATARLPAEWLSKVQLKPDRASRSSHRPPTLPASAPTAGTRQR